MFVEDKACSRQNLAERFVLAYCFAVSIRSNVRVRFGAEVFSIVVVVCWLRRSKDTVVFSVFQIYFWFRLQSIDFQPHYFTGDVGLFRTVGSPRH